MSQPFTVLVSQKASPEDIANLRASFPDIVFCHLPADGNVPPEARHAEVLFRCAMPKDALRNMVSQTPNLKWVHTSTAGFDWVMIPELLERQVTITRSATAYHIPIAEFALTFMLMVSKRMPALLDAQAARQWAPPDPDELAGLTVGIVGAGAIGTELAKRCVAFDMRVIGMRRTPRPVPYFEHVGGPEALPDLLRQSDFVVLACPLTPETRGMIAAPQLRQMKSSAYLINIARGALIVDNDLLQALNEGWIAGACLDAFEQEPLPEDHPLWSAPNTIITPHCSYRSPNGMKRIVAEFKANLQRYLNNEPLQNALGDPNLGY